MSERLLTTRQVAELLGLSPATVLRRWRDGTLPGYRLGSNVLRFDPCDVADYLASCRRGGRTDGERATELHHARPADVVSLLPLSSTTEGGNDAC